ncbi:heavy metal transporter [Candidatus Woesearchaeota archaeon]|nr:heavy metal transporter [Candidatus Woesearchaeota archaeon]HIH37768.1 heavy metal transporter [Candidatus Woesearchaeota archaeon]
MARIKLEVKGMHCKSCKMLIQDVLEDEGAQVISMKIDEKKQVGIITVETDKDPGILSKAIEAEGDYKVTRV